MKKLITLFFLVLLTLSSWAVALKVLEQTKLTFHNFSTNSFDVSNHILTVGTTQYNMNNLMVLSGTINTTAGSYLQVEIPGGIPIASGSVALWAPGTSFPNPSFALMVDFVQWGAAGQAYEAEAVSAGRWQAGTFVNATLPITRSNNYGSFGSSEWASSVGFDESALRAMVSFQPLPFQDELNLRFEQGHAFNEVRLYNVLGELITTKQIMQSTISLSLNTGSLKNGIYLIELRRDDGLSVVRRVVKR